MSKQSKDIAIQVKDITKTFKVPTEASSGIKQKIINIAKGKKGYRNFTPLKDVSFEIHKGDFFGIVGRNGSGKSTLLKLISGIYSPEAGAITVNGSLTPFIELGVGFNPDLTGRENVFLNGALLGFDHVEMEQMYDDIVGFAELADFMDQKLKNYSSGMQVRLAFSIAIRARSDILVLDEVLAVGDEAFQRKCNDYFASIKKTGKTVVLVTHDMNSVRKYCTRAILIDKGNVVIDGSPDDVANQYTLDNFTSPEEKENLSLGARIWIKPLSEQIVQGDYFNFSINYKIDSDADVRFGFSIIDNKAGGSASIIDDALRDENGKVKKVTSTRAGQYSFNYRLPVGGFNNRDFTITAVLHKVLSSKSVEPIVYTKEQDRGMFSVHHKVSDNGLLRDKGEWF